MWLAWTSAGMAPLLSSVLDAGCMAAVDHDIRAGDIGGHGARQEGDDIGDLLGPAHAAQRILLDDGAEHLRLLPFELMPEAALEIDRAGAHGIDPDSLLADLAGERLHVEQKCSLHGAVGDLGIAVILHAG